MLLPTGLSPLQRSSGRETRVALTGLAVPNQGGGMLWWPPFRAADSRRAAAKLPVFTSARDAESTTSQPSLQVTTPRSADQSPILFDRRQALDFTFFCPDTQMPTLRRQAGKEKGHRRHLQPEHFVSKRKKKEDRVPPEAALQGIHHIQSPTLPPSGRATQGSSPQESTIHREGPEDTEQKSGSSLALALKRRGVRSHAHTYRVPGKECHASTPTPGGASILLVCWKGSPLRLEVGDPDSPPPPSPSHTWK